MKLDVYKKIIRASAIYDLVVIFPFALPILAAWNINQIILLHEALSFSGSISTFDPIHLLFVNLMGSLILVWSALRLYKSDVIHGLFDSYIRISFSLLMVFYILNNDVTGVLWLFLLPDMLWGIIQLYGYLKLEKS